MVAEIPDIQTFIRINNETCRNVSYEKTENLIKTVIYDPATWQS